MAPAPDWGKLIQDADFFSLEPERLFPRAAPLEIEIGAGKGDFILERARQFPQHNFLAIELGGAVFQWLAVRCMHSGLDNLRAIRADARPVVNLMLPSARVAAYHIYFPDPWPKSRHSRHRLFTPSMVSGLARSLEPGGHLYVATDVHWYFEHIRSLLAQRGFQSAEGLVPGVGKTNFGRRFMAAGRAVQAGCFQLGSAIGGTSRFVNCDT
ncbi:MAG: tRNA (guanine(46)-N(7))-methyltransferase TrmB [Candidatus Binataceae bacterium]